MLAALLSLCAWAGTITVDVLDIGQGDSILIRTPARKTILIDAGDGKIDVTPMIQGLGVDHLDLVIATHPHADHIGGMEEVVRALPPKLYVDNGLPHTTQTYERLMKAVEEGQIPYRAAIKGTVFNLDDGAKLEILLPGDTRIQETRSDLNSNSVVTRLTNGEDCVLLVGDAEEPTERALLDQGIGGCDVLKVAHHGSRHSSTSSFLAAVKPADALISLGRPNRYRHPGEETLQRLADVGARIWRTDLQGRITVESTGKGVKIHSERSASPEELMVPGDRAVASLDEPLQDRVVQRDLRAEVPRITSLDAAPSPDAFKAAASLDLPANPDAPPAQPAEETPDDPAPAEVCPYFGSDRSEAFHEAGCGNGARIDPGHRVCFATREAAIAAGRRPAGCCKP